jgi:hypothetical protein
MQNTSRHSIRDLPTLQPTSLLSNNCLIRPSAPTGSPEQTGFTEQFICPGGTSSYATIAWLTASLTEGMACLLVSFSSPVLDLQILARRAVLFRSSRIACLKISFECSRWRATKGVDTLVRATRRCRHEYFLGLSFQFFSVFANGDEKGGFSCISSR